MHTANEVFWQYVNYTWPDYLTETILEVGSYDINGSVKEICSSRCEEYIGVDWREGPNVDVVCLAQDMTFDHRFKAVLSASMLEHDPYYEESLATICGLVRPDGILALSWGSAKNPPHCMVDAPDGLFHPLPVNKVLKILEQEGFHLSVLIYDRNIHNLPGVTWKHPKTGGLGEINVVAFPHYTEVVWIDDLLPEDQSTNV